MQFLEQLREAALEMARENVPGDIVVTTSPEVVAKLAKERGGDGDYTAVRYTMHGRVILIQSLPAYR
jgi:hypothetical protein